MSSDNISVEKFVNKVEESGLITIDLETFYPKEEIVAFDLAPFLFMGLILKEKDFREALKTYHWSAFKNKNVALICSVDAVIPMWAYMLLTTYLEPVCANVMFGNEDFVLRALFIKEISKLDTTKFAGKRVVIKGCGDKMLSENAYVEITRLLRPVVKSIMYGEPCSTVPIYKSKIN